MEYPPKRIDPDKLVFDRFHPTFDHWPFTSYCRQFYGGGRIHLRYAWEFHWSGEVRRVTVCRIGMHRQGTWFDQRNNVMWDACMNCGKRLSANQPMDEID